MRPGRDQAMMLSRQATPHSVTVVQNEGEQEEEQEEQEARDKEEEDKHGGVRSGGGLGARSACVATVGVGRKPQNLGRRPRPQTSRDPVTTTIVQYHAIIRSAVDPCADLQL